MIISENTKEYRTQEELDLAISLLNQLKGKSISEIKTLTLLMNVIAQDNSFLKTDD